MKREMVGKWAFVIGLVLTVLIGHIFQAEKAIWILAILGIIVGLLNITGKTRKGSCWLRLRLVCP